MAVIPPERVLTIVVFLQTMLFRVLVGIAFIANCSTAACCLH